MNATPAMMQAAEAQVAPVNFDMAPEQRLDSLTKKLEAVQSDKFRALLDRQNALIERLNSLADLADVAQAERQRAILEADLGKVREEILKRTDNVGVMAAELMALYDELGLQSQRADADSPEDEAKRAAAKAKVQSAMTKIATMQAEKTLAEAEVTKIQGQWWRFIGREEAVAEAQALVTEKETGIKAAEDRLREAEQGVLDVEAQIVIDKADRIRRAGLAQNFALIREFTANAVKVLSEDVSETETRRAVTEGAHVSALKRKAEVARDLDKVRDELATLKRDLEREQKALSEIPDQGSQAYAEQQQLLSTIELKYTEKTGEELKLNSRLMSLTTAIEATKSSLAGLVVQRSTAEVFLIKLENAEKVAGILGHNIDRMIKNTTQETASDALDRASDKMILGAIDLGIKAKVASAKATNDAVKRHDDLMKQILIARDSGDQAMAREAARYSEIDAMIRAGYKERGIDVDMSHLQAAAAAFENRKPTAPPADATAVTF